MPHTRSLFLAGLLLSLCAAVTLHAQEPNGPSMEKSAATATSTATASDPLLKLLVSKGLVTSAEADSVISAGGPAKQRDRLATLLKEKGLISAEELASLQPAANTDTNNNASATGQRVAATVSPAAVSPPPGSQQPSPPRVIAAVAPVRLLPIDAPKREGLIPDIKLGTGVRLKLYGIFKTSVIHDSSS